MLIQPYPFHFFNKWVTSFVGWGKGAVWCVSTLYPHLLFDNFLCDSKSTHTLVIHKK